MWSGQVTVPFSGPSLRWGQGVIYLSHQDESGVPQHPKAILVFAKSWHKLMFCFKFGHISFPNVFSKDIYLKGQLFSLL